MRKFYENLEMERRYSVAPNFPSKKKIDKSTRKIIFKNFLISLALLDFVNWSKIFCEKLSGKTSLISYNFLVLDVFNAF